MSEDKIERSRQYLRSWRATKRVLQKISTQNNNTELDSLEESETVTEGQWDTGDTLGSTENTMNLSSPMSSEASWPSEETDWEDDLEEVMDIAEKKDGTSDQEDSMASYDCVFIMLGDLDESPIFNSVSVAEYITKGKI